MQHFLYFAEIFSGTPVLCVGFYGGCVREKLTPHTHIPPSAPADGDTATRSRKHAEPGMWICPAAATASLFFSQLPLAMCGGVGPVVV